MFWEKFPMFLQLGPICQGTLSFCRTTAAIKRKIHLKGSFMWFPERGKRSMGAHTVETGSSPRVSFSRTFMQHLRHCVGKVSWRKIKKHANNYSFAKKKKYSCASAACYLYLWQTCRGVKPILPLLGSRERLLPRIASH